jgi:hypothetical protein
VEPGDGELGVAPTLNVTEHLAHRETERTLSSFPQNDSIQGSTRKRKPMRADENNLDYRGSVIEIIGDAKNRELGNIWDTW